MIGLIPFALKDAPALIEALFPAHKVSFEAQKERKAGPGQTLTSLGSFWKGRKPLILVRSIILGSLLPQTNNLEKDLEIFEMLMGFDIESLAKRAVIQNAIKPADIASAIILHNPWDYFTHNIKTEDTSYNKVKMFQFPLKSNCLDLNIRWRRDIDNDDKALVIRKMLDTIESYEEKASLCKRPEEIDQEWLYSHVWNRVSTHYKEYRINAHSHKELVEQFGLLRYGRRPKVSDTFSGSGSIPFEAARIGCESYASDINPVACMLTWGAFEIIGASQDKLQSIIAMQENARENVEKKLIDLGIELDSIGNRTKAFLYCIEARCPETGWLVPLSSTWVISPRQNTIAKLVPNYERSAFDIEVISGVTDKELEASKIGTIQAGAMVYQLDGNTYRTPIKTIRGDFKDSSGVFRNKLRRWEKHEFKPRADDIFQERLYAIQWITKESLDSSRKETFFTSVRNEDQAREEIIEKTIAANIVEWQANGFLPDMEIESGYNTDQPIRERGWGYWHQFFSPRDLLVLAFLKQEINHPELVSEFCGTLDFCSKLSRWIVRFSAGGGSDFTSNVFSNQALNTLYNWANRSFYDHEFVQNYQNHPITTQTKIENITSSEVSRYHDIYITDPPYADAVHYHEITEFFIAWLRKNPPSPFDQWTWDSRRALAIKGSGDGFRKGMVNAYKAMAEHMPDNGMQCVMFTHQDTSVWSDMVGIFWAAGLQVISAWYIATETTSELKKGGYVQGTVILMLRKRPAGEKSGFKQRLLPVVRAEVKSQIETMMNLNDEVKDKVGEPVFNDSDLQMAGYAAALKVLTSYTHIGGEDVTNFALRPRTKGEVTVVDEIVQQAAESANSLLVPEGLTTNTWQKLNGIQRFYLRMMDIETTGAAKLDNYQNFAKAFRVEDYTQIMGNMAANKARLKRITEFSSRDLAESNEIGSTWLGHLIIALQQLLTETDPQAVITQLQADLPDFMEIRPLLIEVLKFIENKASEKSTRDATEILGARLSNMRALGN